MIALDTSTFGGWLHAIRQLIGGVLRLDVDAFYAAIMHEDGLWLALIVLLLAGLSVGLGQSVVLFANRVPKGRFLLTLCGGALVGMVTVMFWALTIWLTARFAFDVQRSLRDFAIVVALGCAPAVLGIFLFLPYLGVVFGWLLRVWVFITILVGVGVVGDLTFWQAIVACGAGWLMLELLTRVPILDLDRLRDWVWRRATGRTHRYEGEELAVWLAEQGRATMAAGKNSETGETP